MIMSATPGTYGPVTVWKRPVAVQAFPFTRASWPALNDWLAAELGEGKFYFLISGKTITLHMETREGARDFPLGYVVIVGTREEFYAVSPEVYQDVYGSGSAAS